MSMATGVYMGARQAYGKPDEVALTFAEVDGALGSPEEVSAEVDARAGTGIARYTERPRARNAATKWLIVGQVYVYEKSDGGAKINRRMKLVGLWPNDDDIVEWRAADRATLDVLEHARYTSDIDMKALNPFRRAYLDLPAPARAALLARIIRHIIRV